jgi:hypothetical protein
MATGPTRKEQRVPGVVPIRIISTTEDGETVQCLAHTLNVSRRGARIAGVTVNVQLGKIIRLMRGRNTANFKVVWIGENQQIGVESLEAVGNFWGVDQLQPVSVDVEHEGSRRRTSSKPAK